MKKPYNYIIDYHFDQGINWTDEINRIMTLRDFYIQRLDTNKLLKSHREDLILLLMLLK